MGIPKPRGDLSSIHWFGITKGHWDEIRRARQHTQHGSELPGAPSRSTRREDMGYSQEDMGYSREDHLCPPMALVEVPKRFLSKLQLSWTYCAPPALPTTPWAPGPPVSLSDQSQCSASREFKGVSSGSEVLGDSRGSGMHQGRRHSWSVSGALPLQLLPQSLPKALSTARVGEVHLTWSRNSPALPNPELQADTDTSQPGARGSSQAAPGWHLLLIHPCNEISPAGQKSPKP